MTVETMLVVLGWSSLINIVLLLVWVIWFKLGHDFIFRIHNKWFGLSEESFNSAHYSGLIIYKVLILTLNLVPYLALRVFVSY